MDIFSLVFYKIGLVILSIIVTRFLTRNIDIEEENLTKPNRWILIYFLTVGYYFLVGKPLTLIVDNYDHRLIWNLLLGMCCLIPVFYFRYKFKESYKSIGLGLDNILKSIGIGIIISVGYMIYIYIIHKERLIIPATFRIILLQIGYKFLRAVTNEIIFRGYIQKRIIYLKGIRTGILVSSVLYAVACILVNLKVGCTQPALIGFFFFFKITAGIIYGYLTYKCDNVYASAIVSTITNIW